MGEIIELSPKIIRPTEIDIRKNSLEKVFLYHISNKQNELDPPAVRYYEGAYLTLDGHHRLVMADLFDVRSIKVYLAHSWIDFLESCQVPNMDPSALIITNEKIDLRFSFCLHTMGELEEKNIRTFFQLRMVHDFLHSVKNLEKYLSSKPCGIL